MLDERNRLLGELGKAKERETAQEMEVRRWKDLWEQSRSEVGRSDAAAATLRSQNEGLKASLEQLQRDLIQSKEALSARSTESDSAFILFRQKTEVMSELYLVSDLRKQIKESEIAREEALSRETEVTVQVQRMKQDWGVSETRYKRAIAVRDKEINELQSEGNELISALEDERLVWKREQEGFVNTNAELKSRVEKLSKQVEEVSSTRDNLQQARMSLERQLHRAKADTSTEETSKKALEMKVETLENSLFELKKTAAQQERLLKEASSGRLKAEEQVFNLRAQLNSGQDSSESTSVLQSQINALEQQLAEAVLSQSQIEKLQEKIDILESTNEILQNQKKQMAEKFENEVSRLRAENEGLQSQREQRPKAGQLMNSAHEESLRQSVKMLEMEVSETRNRVKQLEEEMRAADQKYVDAKMGWANADLERETALTRVREAQEKLRGMSQDYTMIEVEFYKVNERLGQTLNMFNDLEFENQQLRHKVEAAEQGKSGKKRR